MGDGIRPGQLVREAAGTQLAMTHIGRRQGTVAQWVAMRPIFEVCAGEKGKEGEDPGKMCGGIKRWQRNSLG